MNTLKRPIRFVLNGEIVHLDAIDPACSVLAYLRNHKRFSGTKEGCAEGDCGACMVAVGELVDDSLQIRCINACIQFVAALDGKALFTVEFLREHYAALHPTQQAMVECHGSQCGFCTPGFVMSLWNCYNDAIEDDSRPDRQQLATALSGNLCRCTGYRTILDAAESMFNLPAVLFNRDRIVKQIRQLECAEPLTVNYEGRQFFAPHSIDELVRLRAEYPDATVLAGCTDIGLWVNKQLRELGTIISVGRVAGLKSIDTSTTHLRIGAGVSLEDAYSAMAEQYPALAEMWERFASMPIRNAGTLGGNIANGSPIGDSMPWLIALRATVVLASTTGSRTIALEALYTDYMQKSMRFDEIVEAVELPLPTPRLVFRTYKVAKRYDSDISAVCAAFAIHLDGNIITKVRVAYGGMAATPERAEACENALRGANWDESTLHVAMQAVQEDFSALSDMRASASYRSRVAANLLHRFYLESRSDNSLPATQTSVFTYAAAPS